MYTGLLPQCDNALRRVGTRSPWKFDVFQTEDNRPGCSQQGSSFNVRLQSGFRCIPTGKGRRQAGDDQVQKLSHRWVRSGRRANRSGVPCSGNGGSICAGSRMRACFNVVWTQKLISAKVARFRRINLEQPRVHHDALEFPDGQVVKLAWLCEGQHATVLQLPASPRATKEAEQQRRCTLVNLIGPLAIAHCTTVVAIEEPSECRWLFDCPGAATKSHCRKRYAGPMNH